MKKTLLSVFLFVSLCMHGQNEFAATSFYNNLKKVYEERHNGFSSYRGVKLKAKYEELAVEYRSTTLLPLSDSGKIVFPTNGNPYALFFFEPEKSRSRIDKRALHLRDAISTAYDGVLFARTITTLVKDHFYSDTYLFASAGETHVSKALFRLYIYYEQKKYQLILEIKGTGETK